MRKEILKDKIKSIRPWSRGDERAPHKPFLLLYALGQFQNGVTTISYEGHEENLKQLFLEFGPDRKPTMANPFTRLITDGIWSVQSSESIDRRKTYSDKNLRDLQAKGGFTAEVRELLDSEPSLIHELSELILHQHFPESLHEEILSASGINEATDSIVIRKRRDPEFRGRILEAYERSCAICGYQIRRDDQIVGLEAAHIKWHQFKGPDTEQNGIAMCSMHHKLFDYGLFAITSNLLLKVSTKANGNHAFDDWLMRFHGKPIRKPQSQKFYPKLEFTNWQANEVFKGRYRE